MLPLGLPENGEGVMGRVTERAGAVRIWRRGSSPPPSVIMRERFGTLGRRAREKGGLVSFS